MLACFPSGPGDRGVGRCAPTRARRHRQAARALAAVIAAVCAVPLSAATPMLRNATIDATFTTPTSCEVEATFTVARGSETSVEHRLYTRDGATVERLQTPVLDVPAPSESTGRLHVLHVRLSDSEADHYTIRYRIVQPDAHAHRCPLWLPTAAADGLSREVRVRVSLPPGAVPAGGGFPSLDWSPGEGVTTLGHIPAFLHVPFNADGDASTARAWDITRAMDTTAIVVLVAGMVAFAWRRKRR